MNMNACPFSIGDTVRVDLGNESKPIDASTPRRTESTSRATTSAIPREIRSSIQRRRVTILKNKHSEGYIMRVSSKVSQQDLDRIPSAVLFTEQPETDMQAEQEQRKEVNAISKRPEASTRLTGNYINIIPTNTTIRFTTQ